MAHVAGWRKRSSSEVLNNTKGEVFVVKVHFGVGDGDKGSVAERRECLRTPAAKA